MELIKFFLMGLFLVATIQSTYAQKITVGDTGDYSSLSAAANIAKPGDTIEFQSQVFKDIQIATNLKGTTNKPIVIMAKEIHQSVFTGTGEGLKFSKCDYIEINGLLVEKQAWNGINIDGGSDFDKQAHHITVKNCMIRDIAPAGSNTYNNLLKVSGIDNFLIENNQFINGSIAGSGIDFVGCHNGIVQDNIFDSAGQEGVLIKGGSNNVRFQRNIFKNTKERAISLGGVTNTKFFRPPLPNPIENAWEATDLEVFGNIFINNGIAVKFTNATRCLVANNTIYKAVRLAVQATQENRTPGFLPTGNNEFLNNIVHVNKQANSTEYGAGTDGNSFVYSNNLWVKEDVPGWQPYPHPEEDEPNEILEDPMFIDADAGNFKLKATSPAIQTGLDLQRTYNDFENSKYKTPPTRGAYAFDTSLSIENNILETIQINIFPNPTKNKINISTVRNIENLTILDLNGKELISANNTTSINLENLSNAIYILKIKVSREKIITRLVVKE